MMSSDAVFLHNSTVGDIGVNNEFERYCVIIGARDGKFSWRIALERAMLIISMHSGVTISESAGTGASVAVGELNVFAPLQIYLFWLSGAGQQRSLQTSANCAFFAS